ncbi:MAG: CRISPR-associated protein Cas4 [Oliverpabstia sp.]
MSNCEITIRSIQHYLYCPHRWGLLEIDKAWTENLFVTKANLLHQRVHDPEKNYVARGKRVCTSVPVFCDLEDYNLYGVVDCLELTENSHGVTIAGSDKKYKISVVEYKPSKPKNQPYNEDDLMQVFAQKLCVDYVFGGDCNGILYYADVKKRMALPLQENFACYDEKLRLILTEMRDYLKRGIVPPIRKGQKCNGCSMKDLCMPSARRGYNLKKEIEKIRDAEEQEEKMV